MESDGNEISLEDGKNLVIYASVGERGGLDAHFHFSKDDAKERLSEGKALWEMTFEYSDSDAVPYSPDYPNLEKKPSPHYSGDIGEAEIYASYQGYEGEDAKLHATPREAWDEAGSAGRVDKLVFTFYEMNQVIPARRTRTPEGKRKTKRMASPSP